jgi:hypothetical protein
MKKKFGLFLLALALTMAAFVTGPVKAAPGPTCNAPACFRTPGCCTSSDCASYCFGLYGPSSIPVCLGECCECDIVEL